jgi:hypothetical protein
MALTPEQLERVRYLAEDEWGGESADEAAQWADFDRVLAQMSAEELHAFVDEMNWDGGGADRLTRVLAHPLCDRGTALMIYWRAQPRFFIKYVTRERVRDELWPSALEDYDMLRDVERRFESDGFATADIPFNPANDKGHDHTSDGPGRRPLIDPRSALPAIMFEPVRGRDDGT